MGCGSPGPLRTYIRRKERKRAEKSVNSSASTSPLFPRGRTMRATSTQSVFRCRVSILEDLKREALAQLHSSGAQQRADGLSGAPLPADHFPKIFRVDPQLEDGHLRAFHGLHLN